MDVLSGWGGQKSQETDGAMWEEPSSHCGREDLSEGLFPERVLTVKNHHGKQRGFLFSEGDIADCITLATNASGAPEALGLLGTE